MTIRLKVYVNAQVDNEVLFDFRMPVRQTPEAVYTQDAEDVGDADAYLYIRGFQRLGNGREDHGTVSGLVFGGNGAPGKACGDYFAKVQLLDERDLAQ